MTQQEIVTRTREEAGVAYVRYLLAVEEGAPEAKRKLCRASWRYVETRYLDELSILRAQEAAERNHAPRD